jgi:hypothetical protein
MHLFALCFLACLSCAHDAAALPRDGGGNYVVRVQDEDGHPLRTFRHGGQTFVLGRFGQRYDIRVENRTGQRVEAVVTVDGRDVISGQVGDFVGARGYLIEAYDELVIQGFRQSSSEVAAFRFTSPRGSYSARMGTPENVGVIGVAVFPERARPVVAQPRPAPMPSWDDDGARYEGEPAPASPRAERSRGHDAAADLGSAASGTAKRKSSYAESAAAAPAARRDNLGTEYGESMSSSVTEVAFERANPTRPAALLTLRYDDREGLLARGIALDAPRVRRPCGPQAFPSNTRFAPPPPPCE